MILQFFPYVICRLRGRIQSLVHTPRQKVALFATNVMPAAEDDEDEAECE